MHILCDNCLSTTDTEEARKDKDGNLTLCPRCQEKEEEE